MVLSFLLHAHNNYVLWSQIQISTATPHQDLLQESKRSLAATPAQDLLQESNRSCQIGPSRAAATCTVMVGAANYERGFGQAMRQNRKNKKLALSAWLCYQTMPICKL